MGDASTDAAPGFRDVPRAALVTGAGGFVGRRLVEMLVERGAKRVVAFDVAPPPADALEHPAVQYVTADIRDKAAVADACRDVDCCFHIAALVGPYHEESAYEAVNTGGTLHVLDGCRQHGVPKLVMSSSPSTRFPYPDPNVRGLTEDALAEINGGPYSPQFHATYAATKAKGERAVLDACSEELRTIAVAPHQVYGPRDPLFMPSILDAARGGKLRVFGSGDNLISLTHVDNYCHGLILGAEALHSGSEAQGRFYIVTDGGAHKFWDALDRAITGVGLPTIKNRRALPAWFMLIVARVVMALAHTIAFVTRRPFPHVMRRLKLNTFAVRMMVIDRYFDISAAERDLHYVPLMSFDEGWADMIAWFRQREPA
ncbi:MAG: NAD-dependent epimerase/dehydratase family protein [Myxococcota bacterium]